MTKYLCNKYEKKLTKLKNATEEQNLKLKKCKHRIRHYSFKNVNKRDESAKQNQTLLRKAQKLLRKQTKDLQNIQETRDVLKNENLLLEESVQNLKSNLEVVTVQLRTKLKKKKLAQKSNSRLRKKVAEIQQSDFRMRAIHLLKQNEDLKQKLEKLTCRAEENETLIENFHQKLEEIKRKH
ncbi:hypothetical protein DPMN_135198 [Dreissena polymorpha]|uniref:Uncharacterized protein n=1 Tax=Dreissena polymorpha TaxID=45954 RepID=A0A9D4JCL8_DREPO|nr:hypothetical protein DPMN_135198 [Dreissena polymorpha]